MTLPTIMTGFRKSGIFPFDPTAPPIGLPAPTAERTSSTPLSRKDRVHNRTVKLMLDGEVEPFENSMSVVIKKPRKKFVPPQGALVSTPQFLEEKKRSEEKNRKGKNKAFIPHFTRPELAEVEDNVEVTAVKGKFKGESKKGKGKKVQKEVENSESDEDDEVCAVCGRWQPIEMRDSKSIQIARWGQCDMCNRWVHLKFCSKKTNLTESEAFICPLCVCEE